MVGHEQPWLCHFMKKKAKYAPRPILKGAMHKDGSLLSRLGAQIIPDVRKKEFLPAT